LELKNGSPKALI
jgi:hypothetical protein